MEPVFQLCSLNEILIFRLANTKGWCYNLTEESETGDKLSCSVQKPVSLVSRLETFTLANVNNSQPGLMVSLASSSSCYDISETTSSLSNV